MSPAVREQIFLTPYYSSSRGWDILLYESLRSKTFLKINVFLRSSLKFSIKFDKIFNFSFFSNFSKNVQNFVRIFDLAITYRRTRDPHQIHRSKKLSPEINSDQNLNGRSLIKNSPFKRKCTNMLQALRMHTFLTPYYSSSRGWDILLYESLRAINYLNSIGFPT